MKYRPEIDGMRAIAVTAVLIYHLKISAGAGVFMAGGFLGVDLFFVLSGFLITKILLLELDANGRISFGNFYARRARRIFPPLLLVILVSLPFAWTILSQSELQRMAMSQIATLLFASNFFWADRLGDYGAQSGLLQPFLHTWSLAIEEQFYLLFPIFLLILKRFKVGLGIGILALLVVSLGISQVATLRAPNLSFFSPISRAWELLAGSGLAYLSIHYATLGKSFRFNWAILATALIVITGYLFAFDLQSWSHPGIATLPFIIACCALLWFTKPGDPITAALSTKPAVFVGKLSYSLYLWHFPIFAFGRLTNAGLETGWDRALWLALTFVLALIGYYLVEKPFRFRVPTRPFSAIMISSVVAIVGFAGVVKFGDNIGANRLANLEQGYGVNSPDNEVSRAQSWAILNDLNPMEDVGPENAHGPTQHEVTSLWYKQTNSRKILVVGDSHSKDLFNALHLSRAQFETPTEIAKFGLGVALAQDQIDQLIQSPNFAASDVVALSLRYSTLELDRFAQLVAQLQQAGANVVVVGNTAEFEKPNAYPVFDWYVRRHGSNADFAELNRISYTFLTKSLTGINQQVSQIAKDAGVPYLSRVDLVCDKAARSCDQATPDGRKALYDYSHWTVDGARHFGQKAIAAGWFSEF